MNFIARALRILEYETILRTYFNQLFSSLSNGNLCDLLLLTFGIEFQSK